MRLPSALMLAAAALLASCAMSPDQRQRELLLGQWQHQAGVLGEQRTSVWAFSGDGSFVLTGHADSRGRRASYVPERGAWTLSGSTLELHHPAVTPAVTPSGNTTPSEARTEARRLVRLTSEEFVTADAKYGIELAYRRVAPK